MSFAKSTTNTDIKALAALAGNTIDIGGGIDVSTWDEAEIYLWLGRTSGTAFTAPPVFRLQKSGLTSPTENDWVDLWSWQMLLGSSIGAQAQSSGGGAGATTITLAAGTNFAAGQWVFFKNGTLANSEFRRVVSVSGAVLTLDAALVNSQSGATCYGQAEQYSDWFNLRGINRLRLYSDLSVTGATPGAVPHMSASFITGL